MFKRAYEDELLRLGLDLAFVFEGVFELLGLGIDDGADVALIGIEGFEVLVVVLGGIEFFQGCDLGGDGVFEFLLGGDFGGISDLVLFLGGVVDGGAILCTIVVALIGGAFGHELAVLDHVFLGDTGRIVGIPKEVDDLFVGGDGGVKCDLDDFSVAGVAFADLFIRRVFGFAAGVATNDFFHPFNEKVLRLNTPKAAATDDGGFSFGRSVGGVSGEGGHEGDE